MRFSNYQSLLGDNPLIYVYAREKDDTNRQLNFIKAFCKKKNIRTSKIYIDNGSINKLDYKISLNNLIRENKNNNVLILNSSKLTRNNFELLELQNICHQKNINFYDITSDNFIFNRDLKLLKDMIKGSDNKMQRNLDVLYVQPNKLPTKMTIKNTLEAKQKLVGGPIKYTYLKNCNDIAIIYSEQEKLLEQSLNRNIEHDVISGNFIVVGDDAELGEDRSLTKVQIDKYTKYFSKESIKKTNEMTDELLKKQINEDYCI